MLFSQTWPPFFNDIFFWGYYVSWNYLFPFWLFFHLVINSRIQLALATIYCQVTQIFVINLSSIQFLIWQFLYLRKFYPIFFRMARNFCKWKMWALAMELTSTTTYNLSAAHAWTPTIKWLNTAKSCSSLGTKFGLDFSGIFGCK